MCALLCDARRGRSGYPQFATMREIIDNWNPDEVEPPPTFAKYDSLLRLDMSEPSQAALALKLRTAELPFIAFNHSNIDAVVARWTDEYLERRIGTDPLRFEVAENNHFMFSRARGDEHPQGSVRAPYEVFAERAKLMPGEAGNGTFWYWQTGSAARGMSWVMDDLRALDPAHPSFFIVDNGPGDYRGIHCRFGAAGIIAESHYDGHRNFIAMLRGHKRYILNPPDQCGNLGLLKSGPSARHSYVDWSSPDNPSRSYHKPAPPEWYDARGVDAVLTAGDVLYVPSYYFHNPISLDRSIQCNARSGVSAWGQRPIRACGFSVDTSSGSLDEAAVRAAREEVAGLVPAEGGLPPGGRLALDGGRIAREKAHYTDYTPPQHWLVTELFRHGWVYPVAIGLSVFMSAVIVWLVCLVRRARGAALPGLPLASPAAPTRVAAARARKVRQRALS